MPVRITCTFSDRFGVDIGARKNKSNELIDLGRESQKVGTNQLRQQEGGVFTQADLPFASEVLCPLDNLVRKRRAELGYKPFLGAEGKKGLPQIHSPMSADDQRLSCIAELCFFRQTLAVRRLERFSAFQDNQT